MLVRDSVEENDIREEKRSVVKIKRNKKRGGGRY
jgi:hypothetical protein